MWFRIFKTRSVDFNDFWPLNQKYESTDLEIFVKTYSVIWTKQGSHSASSYPAMLCISHVWQLFFSLSTSSPSTKWLATVGPLPGKISRQHHVWPTTTHGEKKNVHFSMCSHFKLGVTKSITPSRDSSFWAIIIIYRYFMRHSFSQFFHHIVTQK